MKQPIALLLAAAACSASFAQPASSPVESARVLSSVAVYSEVQVQRTDCNAQAASPDKPNLVGVGLGAVAGGLLGHTVGGGNGKSAATAVGAVAGALVGNNIANRNTASKAQDCKSVNETQTRLVGYRVRYEWNGREFESVVRGYPGNTLPVQVSAIPVDAQ